MNDGAKNRNSKKLSDNDLDKKLLKEVKYPIYYYEQYRYIVSTVSCELNLNASTINLKLDSQGTL